MIKTPICRQQLKGITTILSLVLGCMGTGWAVAAEDGDAIPEHEYSKGVKRCMLCHKEGKPMAAHEIFLTPMGISGDPRAPFADGNHDCEACHGPSKSHLKRKKGVRPPPPITFDDKTPVEAQNKVCLACHDTGARFHWPGSVHDTEGLACVDCHDRHVPDDPVMNVQTQSAVCFKCHQEQRAQFLRQSRHPVQGTTSSLSHVGLMACTDCHQPHGSAGPGALKRNTINEQCYDCHAEKRGPFLWEHAPVSEDCTNCHTPHGSNHENLLIARQPWLCQQCHVARFHSSDVYSGTGIPPSGADQRMLGKQCLNCHVQIHGSNHPSGVRLTR